ncbi:hypothetical protein GQ600_16003 [Phytophthora cactorum]|nr:hypothetical protein GQ600_16003 [Phytophthora cactorum]
MKLKDDGMTHLASDAVIVKDPDFESACVLALSGRIEELTGDQQQMLDPFEMTRKLSSRTPRLDVLRALRTKYWRPQRSKEQRRRRQYDCSIIGMPGIITTIPQAANRKRTT